MRITDDYLEDLVAFEGSTTWLYCDSRGYVTVGIGCLVKTAEAAVELPFHHLGSGAETTDEEKRAGWSATLDAFAPGKSANYYRPKTSLRLTEDCVRALAIRRVQEDFIPGIRRLLPEFDSMPLPARKALVDMAYNLGVGGLAGFHAMISACLARDWATAARECHRTTASARRNAWTAQMFIDADATEARPGNG